MNVHSGSHLNARLAEAEPLAQFLPHEGVRIVGLVEQPLQLVQLLQREVGARPALLVTVQIRDAAAAGRAVMIRCRRGVVVVVRNVCRRGAEHQGRGCFRFALGDYEFFVCDRWRGGEDLSFSCLWFHKLYLVSEIFHITSDSTK